MVAYTTRHQLPYPTTGDPLSTVDNTLQSLAEAVDEKLDIRRHTTGLKYAKNLAYYEEQASNLPGYLVLQTNLTMGNYMCRFDFRGYTYNAVNNIIDTSITAYGFQADNTFYSYDMNQRGTQPFTNVWLMTRISDGKIAVALQVETASNYWQYPKVAVDAYVGHTEATTAQLNGWTLTRQANLNAYTIKRSGLAGNWTPLTLVNGWANYANGFQDARYKKVGPIVELQGLIRSGTVSATVATLPEGFRPAGGKLIFPAYSDSGVGRVDIVSDGSVQHVGGGNAWFSLSNVKFTAER